MSFHLKDPGAILDYAVDWGTEYLDGDVIASSSFVVEPDEPGGAAIVASSFDERITVVTIGGGIAGRQYRVTNHVVMQSTREDERTIVLRVEQR